jgi:transposase-like protein
MSVPAIYIAHALNLYYGGMRINDIRKEMQQKYGYSPSAALIRFWVEKYTTQAAAMIQKYHPRAGDTWVADEFIVRIGGKKYWLYDIIDDKTCYILALLITLERSRVLVKNLIQTAAGIAGRLPKLVMIYIPSASFNTMDKGSGYKLEHVPRETYADRHRIGILFQNNIHQIRNLNYFRTPDTADRFLQGLTIHYNYFKKNEAINNRTPASNAKITYPYHSWQELIESSARG